MPIFSGLQQFAEGFVWSGMTDCDPFTVLVSALVFTWFTWPFWIPSAVCVLCAGTARQPAPAVDGNDVGGRAGLWPDAIRAASCQCHWVEVSVNQDSLAYDGTMTLYYLMPHWMA